MKFDWTPELIDQMLSLLDSGLSTAQVARQMGTTRNSVIGKAHRERVKRGLPAAIRPLKRKPSITDISRPPRQRRTKVQLSLALPERAESVSPSVSPIVTVSEPAPDLGQLASIVDVTGCRWPVRDDADFVGGVAFCNHSQDEGSSYCPYHRAKNKAAYSDELVRRTFKQVNYILKKVAA
jgi:GcrA cell cycle regulator